MAMICPSVLPRSMWFSRSGMWSMVFVRSTNALSTLGSLNRVQFALEVYRRRFSPLLRLHHEIERLLQDSVSIHYFCYYIIRLAIHQFRSDTRIV
ncbi:hypothetical protein BRADI_3g44332v3 [Brachypodium distachyon]|uniref:Uncharacterized protein n=1 Tax=Brachypodium distachyon TaxID=15368 RepID=A0A2K2D335_BRADI|nr:hypothetical protein BRADI_3g44332v3 [Brachypodium distachyon]